MIIAGLYLPVFMVYFFELGNIFASCGCGNKRIH